MVYNFVIQELDLFKLTPGHVILAGIADIQNTGMCFSHFTMIVINILVTGSRHPCQDDGFRLGSDNNK